MEEPLHHRAASGSQETRVENAGNPNPGYLLIWLFGMALMIASVRLMALIRLIA
jgi:hypothetical protein